MGASEERPFAGLRVLDFSQGVAGPHCGLLLAEAGADVVKVEPPGGEWGRNVGKTFGAFSAHFVSYARGKRSVVLDLRTEAGRAAAKRLAIAADVVIEAFRPGVMERNGLGAETLRALKPSLVYVSVNGFGDEGPLKDAPATDGRVQAFTGLIAVNKGEDGRPHKINLILVDITTGMYAFQATATALYAVAKGRPGRHLKISMLQAAAALQAPKLVQHATEGDAPEALYYPAGVFATKDGAVNVLVMKAGEWEKVCERFGWADLAADARFATKESRVAHEAVLRGLLLPRFKAEPNAYWEKHLGDLDIMHAPIYGYAEFLAHPQTAISKAVATIEHEAIGKIPVATVPGYDPVDPASRLARAPEIGEHTDEVLREWS